MKAELVGQQLTEEKPKTTLRLSPDLVKQFKYIALDRNTTVTALVEEAMRQYLKSAKK